MIVYVTGFDFIEVGLLFRAAVGIHPNPQFLISLGQLNLNVQCPHKGERAGDGRSGVKWDVQAERFPSLPLGSPVQHMPHRQAQLLAAGIQPLHCPRLGGRLWLGPGVTLRAQEESQAD